MHVCMHVYIHVCMKSEKTYYLVGMGRRSVLGLYAGSGQDRMNSENKPLAGMYARMYAYVCMYVCMGSEFFFIWLAWDGAAC